MCVQVCGLPIEQADEIRGSDLLRNLIKHEPKDRPAVLKSHEVFLKALVNENPSFLIYAKPLFSFLLLICFSSIKLTILVTHDGTHYHDNVENDGRGDWEGLGREGAQICMRPSFSWRLSGPVKIVVEPLPFVQRDGAAEKLEFLPRKINGISLLSL